MPEPLQRKKKKSLTERLLQAGPGIGAILGGVHALRKQGITQGVGRSLAAGLLGAAEGAGIGWMPQVAVDTVGAFKGASVAAFWAELEKIAQATAEKTNPALWERAKAQARAKMGGKHSARAMQLATQIYKKGGGGYRGAKPSSASNSLKRWTKQDWKWSGGDNPGQGGRGVYLPAKKIESLRSQEGGREKLRRAAALKAKATRAGEQYSSHGLAAGTSLKKGK